MSTRIRTGETAEKEEGPEGGKGLWKALIRYLNSKGRVRRGGCRVSPRQRDEVAVGGEFKGVKKGATRYRRVNAQITKPREGTAQVGRWMLG